MLTFGDSNPLKLLHAGRGMDEGKYHIRKNKNVKVWAIYVPNIE